MGRPRFLTHTGWHLIWNVGGVRELRQLIALVDGLRPWSGQPWERGTIEALATPQFAVNYAGGNEAK